MGGCDDTLTKQEQQPEEYETVSQLMASGTMLPSDHENI